MPINSSSSHASDSRHRHLPSWRALNADTAPWAEEIQLKFFREAPAWRKVELAADLTRGMLLLAQSSLEDRHPGASASQIRRLLAEEILGSKLAARVYGPLTREDEEEAPA